MTRHSTLTNENDLHYAKIRVFTGDPNLISPEFTDQILVATDTNKIYRSTGSQVGNLVELSPNTGGNNGGNGIDRVKFNIGTAIAPDAYNQLLIDTYANRIYRATGLNLGDWVELVAGGNGGTPSTIGIGTGDPQDIPDQIGQQYFDFAKQTQWVAVRSGSLNGWVETGDRTDLGLNVVNNSSQSIGDIHVFYADIGNPTEIEGSDYTFTNYLGTIGSYFFTGNLNNLVFSQGRGAFLFALDVDTSLVGFSLTSQFSFYMGYNIESRFELRTSPCNLFADNGNEFLGKQVGSQYLWIPSYKHNSQGGQVSALDARITLTVYDL